MSSSDISLSLSQLDPPDVLVSGGWDDTVKLWDGRAHFAQSRRLIRQFLGREIKTIGDSFMTAFKSVDAALGYALALQAKTGHDRVQIRAGMHIGPMHVEESDVFGGTVSFAARVVGVIQDAEIWLSESRHGARYNYPGVLTVYLTEDYATCFAEKMFYFQREVVRGMDLSAHTGISPPFQQTFVSWVIAFSSDVTDVFDMSIPGAANYIGIFPSLTLNPSQDYYHLKDKRAEIEHNGYNGIRVRSSRATHPGNLVVLFQAQSSNIHDIIPYPVEFRLIDINGNPFYNHTTEILDFTAGEVRGLTAGPGGRPTPWQRIDFHH